MARRTAARAVVVAMVRAARRNGSQLSSVMPPKERMRPQQDIEEAMHKHADAVWRVCVLHFPERQDAQDAFQNTFLNYALAVDARFNDEEHRKAWLLRAASNACKDLWRASSRRAARQAASDNLAIVEATDSSTQPGSFSSEVIDAMRGLDDPPRTPLYLSLYEGYTAPEIADMLAAPVNTVYTWIARGKATLRELLR